VPGFPGGRQWFPITRLDPVQLAEGVQSAARGVDDFIDAELGRLQLTPSACALVGFSQGTMMSLHVGLRRTEPLAAVVGYSGALTAPERLPRELRTSPPVLLVHGDADEMVPVAAAFEAFAALGASGVRAQLHISSGLSHSIDEAGLALGGAFLRDAFAGRLAGWLAPAPAR
jgi:phospholipase/carboxylesterase